MSTLDQTVVSLETAQANTLAAIQAQVRNLNDNLKSNYLTAFNNWAQSILTGRPANGEPPKPPMAYVVGYFTDPTTGPGGILPAVQWAYPMEGAAPVCDMPPVPPIPAPPAPLPEREDIRNVPLGDMLPVGFKMTAPDGGVWQKQASPTPFGIAYFYVRVS